MNFRITLAAVLTASFVLAGSGVAQAKAICLHDGFKPYIFSKVKLPKKPGATTTFVGTAYQTAVPASVASVSQAIIDETPTANGF